MWAATTNSLNLQAKPIFQSTLPVWAATEFYWPQFAHLGISIHAARVGSDASVAIYYTYILRFQSTLPVWAATSIHYNALLSGEFQSTLPVWAATQAEKQLKSLIKQFQSTLPVWAATFRPDVIIVDDLISIHAARVGSDSKSIPKFLIDLGISIHAARVGSDKPYRFLVYANSTFQSTLPVWAATFFVTSQKH